MSDQVLRFVERVTRMPPALRSRNRTPPQWWTDARLGIFVHWTMASVPAYAPRDLHIREMAMTREPNLQAESPYVEWYPNSIRFPTSSAGRYHRETYGDLPYEAFREPFEAGFDQWDPEGWAAEFAATGAGYVVLVAKHHDGYCLWPTDVPNPHRPGWNSERDIVGELAAAIRAAGMRFGLYYSGGYDFTFNAHPIGSYTDSLKAVPFGEYPAYAAAQVRELVERYEPSVLWNDICWPAPQGRIYQLLEHYFEVVPDGCVNDRWMSMPNLTRLLRVGPIDRLANEMARRALLKNGLVPPQVAFSQHRTPEYADLPTGMKGAWEMTRGMDLSFGYNKFSTEDDYLTKEELLGSLADTLAKGGNFLINVGPRGEDAQIPDEHRTRLRWMAEANERSPWRDLPRRPPI
ncbi:MAG: alpha-L-fucosidase [Acidimicrobiales bacterium]